MPPERRLPCLTAALLFCGSFWIASAQTTTATLFGVVRDDSGAVVPEAKITARNTATSFTRTGLSNETGAYLITNLPVGPYSLAVEKEGFRTVRSGGHYPRSRPECARRCPPCGRAVDGQHYGVRGRDRRRHQGGDGRRGGGSPAGSGIAREWPQRDATGQADSRGFTGLGSDPRYARTQWPLGERGRRARHPERNPPRRFVSRAVVQQLRPESSLTRRAYRNSRC